MGNGYRLVCLSFVLFLLANLSHVAKAAVEWEVQKTLQTGSIPITTKISADGQMLFVLTENRKIIIYSADGEYKDTLQVNESVDDFEVAPAGDRLFLTDKEHKSIQVVSLDFIYNINITGSPFKGPGDAPVTLALFSDFQCPYCSKIRPELDQVMQMYPKDVKLVFKNLPLTRIHKYAMNAAEAALAAAEQGKFWEFHDKLFAIGNGLNDQKIEEIAEQLGLDKERFDKDRSSDKIRMAIIQDMRDAAEAKVRGTPTVFVNGRIVKDRSPAGFRDIIEKELARIRGNNGG